MIHRRQQQVSFFSRACVLSALALSSLAACSSDNGSGGGSSSRPISAYCPYLPSKTFGSGVTLNGDAFYEYRKDGNGEVSDSASTLTLTTGVTSNPSITINGVAISYSCSLCTSTNNASGLTAAINAGSLPVVASASNNVVSISPRNYGDSISLTAPTSNVSVSAHNNPAPIRRAEVAIANSAGVIVQCGETDDAGHFSMELPGDGAQYTVKVLSRANNGSNTAYVMNDPTNNEPYAIASVVNATGSPITRLIAKATTAGIEGGAFNILDQIYNAQKYLRTQTAPCNVSSNAPYYFPDCDPFVTAPIVKTYWKAGLSPGIYQGISGGISFYLNGRMELYILGGLNGDTNSADMDHYDNSVIVHEYGHFIEDQFGAPNSPGGSHNGNGIIDPRLAWGEGWANFFQAAVLNNPVYRDTYGRVGCTGPGTSGHSSCTGIAFNEDLDPTSCGTPHLGMSSQDCATAAGEGNFREFSVTRALYSVAKSGSSYKFSEIWNALRGPNAGMRVIADAFKSMGRLHKIQSTTTGHTDWYNIRSTELQSGDSAGNGILANYATPINLGGCSSTNASMSIVRKSGDDGSLAKSNQFQNNDFYVINWPGGAFSANVQWSGSGVADLDLYIYKAGYTFGSSSSIAAFSSADSNTTSGSETVAANLPAGQYMINVSAYTGIYSSGSTTYSTTYNLTVNSQAVCPAP